MINKQNKIISELEQQMQIQHKDFQTKLNKLENQIMDLNK